MATADMAWPVDSSMPQLPLLGSTETPTPNTIRTQTDTGPAKVRRRSTSAPTVFRMMMILTEAQANLLMDFWHNDSEGSPAGTSEGHRTFDGLQHPRTDSTTVVWRFVEPPTLTIEEFDTYRANLVLEVLP